MGDGTPSRPPCQHRIPEGREVEGRREGSGREVAMGARRVGGARTWEMGCTYLDSTVLASITHPTMTFPAVLPVNTESLVLARGRLTFIVFNVTITTAMTCNV